MDFGGYECVYDMEIACERQCEFRIPHYSGVFRCVKIGVLVSVWVDLDGNNKAFNEKY
jgi:hypothetical protein